MAVAASVCFERLTSGLFFSSIVTTVFAREVCFHEEIAKKENKYEMLKIRMLKNLFLLFFAKTSLR